MNTMDTSPAGGTDDVVNMGGSAGAAFGLVIFAGGATAIGASVVFFPRLGVKLANRKMLAGSLGLSAGVMLYISMVDIYQKSVAGFVDAGHSDDHAFIYATICFFCGCLSMALLNRGVDLLLSLDEGSHLVSDDFFPPEQESTIDSNSGNSAGEDDSRINNTIKLNRKGLVPSSAPSAGVEKAARGEESQKQPREHAAATTNGSTTTVEEGGLPDVNTGVHHSSSSPEPTTGEQEQHHHQQQQQQVPTRKAQSRLYKVGVATALAIAIHNLPEGLVTFIAYMEDPAVGIALAVGIAIHNIPEGLCVSMPLYYATGNRWSSFLWGMLSGISEPIGALIGWLILKRSFSSVTYGIMFGLVAGIMTFITLDELLPTAHRYDPKNTVVTKVLFLGMFAIALSLVLFSL